MQIAMWLQALITELAAEIIVVLLGIIAVLARRQSRTRIRIIARSIYIWITRLFKGPYAVLLYVDCYQGGAAAEVPARLRKQLNEMRKQPYYRVEALADSEYLAAWPLSAYLVRAMIVLVTDVTKLGSSKAENRIIQERLIKYVRKGGVLVLGHDTLYRRSHNDRLQEIAGFSLSRFAAVGAPLTYVKHESTDHKCRDDVWFGQLKKLLILDDREYLIADQWDGAVEFLYDITVGSEKVPGVTRRPSGKGVVYWINAADATAKGPAPSIFEPAPDLIYLLNEIVSRGSDRTSATASQGLDSRNQHGAAKDSSWSVENEP